MSGGKGDSLLRIFDFIKGIEQRLLLYYAIGVFIKGEERLWERRRVEGRDFF